MTLLFGKVNAACTYHLGALEVADSQHNLVDSVTAHQLDNLGGCGELGVHLDGRQLEVL